VPKAKPPKPGKDIAVEALLRKARQIRRKAYAPYSHYKVGAALLGASGKVYLGCNVENASYGLSLCAERNAFGQAIAAGEKKFLAIAVTAAGPDPVPPCGMCRQVLAEFMAPSAVVVCENERRARALYTVAELLPFAFTKRFF
jgi:cytidine deaminase